MVGSWVLGSMPLKGPACCGTLAPPSFSFASWSWLEHVPHQRPESNESAQSWTGMFKTVS